MTDAPDGTAARTAHRVGVAWRMLSADLRRWPFDLAVNVVLASPLVPRLVRVALLRALGMPLRNLDLYPWCRFRTTKLKVGKGTVINAGCHFDNDAWIEIGDDVGVAMNVTFLTAGHTLITRDTLAPGECRAGGLQLAPIVVGDGAWIGANAVILPGVTIGAGCVVAAGSIVRTDCASDGMYGGVPAKRIDRDRTRVREEAVAR